MPKNNRELAADIDAAIKQHVQQLRAQLDPLVIAYQALTDGKVPPSITAAFSSPPKPAPEANRKKPKAKAKAKAKAPRHTGASPAIANQQAIVQVLGVADGPLTIPQLAERLPMGRDTIANHLARLVGETIVTETRPARGPHAATFALTARLGEWDDPEQLDEDLVDEDEPVLPGEEPPPLEDDESTAAAIAAAAAPHSPTSNAGIVSAGMSARVRRALERERLAPAATTDSDRRPEGEDLLRVCVRELDGTRLKPRDVARSLVLPAPEVAQAIRVGTERGWIERLDDGTYTAIPGAMPADNGQTAAVA